MGCFCCFKPAIDEDENSPELVKAASDVAKGKNPLALLVNNISHENDSLSNRLAAEELLKIGNGENKARVFTYPELQAATNDFNAECLVGEGGFRRVYKGHLEYMKQDIAVKQLDKNGLQGNREFLVEVLMLSLLHHPNLVNLIGYCADGIKESGATGLEYRMKIAQGAAKGLEYLHEKVNPHVIYRDFKASNILLGGKY